MVGGEGAVANNLRLKDMLGPAILSVHREAVLSSDAKDALNFQDLQVRKGFSIVSFMRSVLYQRFHCILTACSRNSPG